MSFDGVNISKSIRPYLLSLQYTDNEEDEADDLQIRLQDREQLWMEKWIEPMIQAASVTKTESTTTATASAPKSYKVTPAIGLNIRTGPGTNYGKLGAFSCGTVISVESIENGWAKITYSGKTAYVSASYIKATDEKAADGKSESTVTAPALKIHAVLVHENSTGGGNDRVLDCGQFELDTVRASGPPATVTLKATGLPFSNQIRQMEKSRAWENYSLAGIAGEIARSNGMGCMFESAQDPAYTRVEQFKESDIAFLSRLCKNAGISLKATNNIIVLFDQANFEEKPPAFTIRKGHGYISYDLSVGTADVQYTSCRVRYTDPTTGKCIEGIARVEDYKEDAKNNQQLEVTAKVSSIGEAKALAEKRLRMHNRFSKTAVFTLPGDTRLLAGVTGDLEGWGFADGKYIIKQAVHTMGASGYTTKVTLRRVLEGY